MMLELGHQEEMMMPAVSGITLLKTMRVEEALREVPSFCLPRETGLKPK